MPYNPKSKNNLILWKPGVSANPLGRPKGRVSLTRIIQELLKDRHFQGVPNPKDKLNAECLMEAMFAHAVVNGNASLFQQILDRNDGKIAEPEPDRSRDEQIAASLREKRAKRTAKISGNGNGRHS